MDTSEVILVSTRKRGVTCKIIIRERYLMDAWLWWHLLLLLGRYLMSTSTKWLLLPLPAYLHRNTSIRWAQPQPAASCCRG